jgi:hypothetical protein
MALKFTSGSCETQNKKKKKIIKRREESIKRITKIDTFSNTTNNRKRAIDGTGILSNKMNAASNSVIRYHYM